MVRSFGHLFVRPLLVLLVCRSTVVVWCCCCCWCCCCLVLLFGMYVCVCVCVGAVFIVLPCSLSLLLCHLFTHLFHGISFRSIPCNSFPLHSIPSISQSINQSFPPRTFHSFSHSFTHSALRPSFLPFVILNSFTHSANASTRQAAQ